MSRIKHPASVVGNPTRQVELQQSTNGTDYVSFTLASPTRVKDSAGQWVNGTPLFYRVKAFGRLARRLAALPTNVQLVLVGDLQIESYTNKDGQTRQATSLIVRHCGASILFHTPQQAADQDPANPWEESCEPDTYEDWAEQEPFEDYE